MRIGLILNILDEEYQISIYNGIKKKAEQYGIDIICFQQDFTSITSDNLLSSFTKKGLFNLDGIILLSSVLADNYSITKKTDVEKLFGNLPVISIGMQIEGIPSLIVKSKNPMEKLIEHLIFDHKYRKFLYIGGSKLHADAEERECIFKSVISKNMTEIPELQYSIKRSWFNEQDAIKSMEEYLIESSGQLPDVIVCANDNMALGVYKFFKRNQNKKGFKECAVTGFDDIPQSGFEVPSLTTIHQPLSEIGEKAVDMIYPLVLGEKQPDTFYVNSKLIIRESCGCIAEKKHKEPSDFIRLMQSNFVHSEGLLRMISHTGQELNYAETIEELNQVINRNLEQLDIQNFVLVQFSAPENRAEKHNNKGFLVKPVYVRRRGIEIKTFYKEKDISIGDLYKSYLELYNDISVSLVLKYLVYGNEIIGCAFYDANKTNLQYLSSITINFSQALNRINQFEEKKKRSEYLESEVTKRTKQLVEANKKRLKVEADVLRISELERQRFSNDLHDDICQRLAGISMLCKSYSASGKPVEKAQVEELTTLISDTLQRTRQYAHNSFPVELTSLGIEHSISNLCNSFEVQSGIKCTYKWEVSDVIQLSTRQKLNVFRIIQESLHNAMKHSQATEVNVSVISQGSLIEVIVKDNGKGLPSSLTPEQYGLGLNSIQYRANQIGAVLTISSNEPKGTCVKIVFSFHFMQ